MSNHVDGGTLPYLPPHPPTPHTHPHTRTDREVYTPSSWFVYFGIEEVIRSQFFTNPAFCKERGKFRTDNPPGSAMWNGEH